jgi:hypothetical protein
MNSNILLGCFCEVRGSPKRLIMHPAITLILIKRYETSIPFTADSHQWIIAYQGLVEMSCLFSAGPIIKIVFPTPFFYDKSIRFGHLADRVCRQHQNTVYRKFA